MLKKRQVLKNGLSYNIIVPVCIAVVVIFGFLIYNSYQNKVCNAGNYDVFYFLKALKTSDSNLCKKTTRLSTEITCIALLKNDVALCSSVSEDKKNFCIASVKKDLSLCEEDGVCNALIARNPDVCISKSVEHAGKYGKEPLAGEKLEKRKKVCVAYANLDADFFVSKEMLKKC